MFWPLIGRIFEICMVNEAHLCLGFQMETTENNQKKSKREREREKGCEIEPQLSSMWKWKGKPKSGTTVREIT